MYSLTADFTHKFTKKGMVFDLRRKKANPEEKAGLREHIANSFESSKEILLDVPRLVFIGNREVTVENYRGIVEYTDKLLVLEANPCRLSIEGKNLEVKTITQEMLYIKGIFSKVEFKREA